MDSYGLGLVLDFRDQATAEMNQAVNTLNKLMKTVDRLADTSGTAGKRLDNNFQGLAKSVSSSASNLSNSINGVVSGMYSLGGAIIPATVALGGVAYKSAMTSIEFMKLKESSKIAFDVLLGGADQATAMMDNLYTYAKTTPFSYDTYLQVGKSLITMGTSAESVIPTLNTMTNAAIATGEGQEGIFRLSNSIGQMTSLGKVSLEQLRSMMEMGVPAVKILGNAYGLTTEEMYAMISTGEIMTEDALPMLLKGMDEGSDGVNGMTAAYGGLANKMQGTMAGALDKLHSRFRNVSNEIWDANNAFPALTTLIGVFTDALSVLPTVFKGITEAITPAITQTTEWLRGFTEYVKNANPDQIKAIGTAIVSVVTLAPALLIFGKALSFVGGMFETVSKISNSLSDLDIKNKGLKVSFGSLFKVVAVVSAVFYAYQTNMFGFADFINKTFIPALSSLAGFLGDLFNTVKPFWDEYGTAILSTASAGIIVKALADIATVVRLSVIPALGELATALGVTLLPLIPLLAAGAVATFIVYTIMSHEPPTDLVPQTSTPNPETTGTPTTSGASIIESRMYSGAGKGGNSGSGSSWGDESIPPWWGEENWGPFAQAFADSIDKMVDVWDKKGEPAVDQIYRLFKSIGDGANWFAEGVGKFGDSLAKTFSTGNSDSVKNWQASIDGWNAGMESWFSLLDSWQTKIDTFKMKIQVMWDTVATILAKMGIIKDTGAQTTGMLSSGMESDRSSVEGTAESIATVVQEKYGVLPEKTFQIGGQSSEQMGAGIAGGEGAVTTSTQGVHDTVMTTLDPLKTNTNPIGMAVADGLVAGMQAVGLAEPVQGLVTLVINAFKKGFNINSPSKETTWIGENIVFGLINGLSSIELGSFANNMVGTLVEAFKSGALKAQHILDVLGEGAKDALKLVGITFGATANQLGMPLNSSDVTSSFGYREDPFTGEQKFHAGTDFGAAMGDSVFATGDGTVVQAGENSGYGLSVTIDHGNGLETLYGHLSEVKTSVGKAVTIGELIGLVGSTGNSTGPHLHYEVRQDGSPIAPSFATGTNMFSGGIAQVNESGGEIIDLPSGSQVLPHDKTVEVSKAQGEAEALKSMLTRTNQQTPPVQQIDNSLQFGEGSVIIQVQGATDEDMKEAVKKFVTHLEREKQLKGMSIRTPIFRQV